jgi:membrane protein implicated in regulation of membrane protease activity
MRVLFIISIAYGISSINVLLLAFGIVQTIPSAAYNVPVMLAYCLISFAYGLVLSVYHLYTFLARRKRNEDKIQDAMRH